MLPFGSGRACAAGENALLFGGCNILTSITVTLLFLPFYAKQCGQVFDLPALLCKHIKRYFAAWLHMCARRYLRRGISAADDVTQAAYYSRRICRICVERMICAGEWMFWHRICVRAAEGRGGGGRISFSVHLLKNISFRRAYAPRQRVPFNSYAPRL